MYSVRWLKRGFEFVVVGGREDALGVTSLLENAGIPFKVADCRGFQVGQEHMGVGGLSRWLAPGDTFPDPDATAGGGPTS